jgi:hypothetical protein
LRQVVRKNFDLAQERNRVCGKLLERTSISHKAGIVFAASWARPHGAGVEHSAATRSGSGRGLVKHAGGRRPSGRRVPLARLRPVEGGVAVDPPPSSQKAREGDAADGDSREIDLSTFSTPLSVLVISVQLRDTQSDAAAGGQVYVWICGVKPSCVFQPPRRLFWVV